ncbi:MAG TPA: glycosyltransferase family 2 protein [Acidimicrobiales bacterium]|nr:glycosyltransferase family 2 protein [Acidimicrobiales bacterium]
METGLPRATLSIVIPIKDEEATLVELIDLVERAEVPDVDKEIVIVDDGSTDATASLLDGYRNRPGFVVIDHPTNHGKGAAIRSALGAVTGDVVVIQDADHEYDPSDFASLIAPILDGRTRVVYGSRFLGTVQGMAWPNRVANKILSGAASLIGNSRVTDEATCYKAFDATLLRALPLRCRGFEFCPEVTGLLQGLDEPIVEVPISYVGRGRDAGKKVRAKDGFIAITWLLWSRFGRRAERARVRTIAPAGRVTVSL